MLTLLRLPPLGWVTAGAESSEPVDAAKMRVMRGLAEQRIERGVELVREAPFFRTLVAALRRHCHNAAAAAEVRPFSIEF